MGRGSKTKWESILAEMTPICIQTTVVVRSVKLLLFWVAEERGLPCCFNLDSFLFRSFDPRDQGSLKRKFALVNNSCGIGEL